MFNYTNAEGNVKVGKLLTHIFGGLLALTLVFGCFVTVSNGTVGIVTRFNAIIGNLQPGIHFKMPLIDSVKEMPVSTMTVNYDRNGSEGDFRDSSQLSGASKDLQDVFIGVVVNYRVDATKVNEVFTQYKTVENFQTSFIEPTIREVVKQTSAQYTAEELVTKRAEYSDKVNTALSDRFSAKWAMLDKFNVTNFEFSKSFTQAIENKVTAVQNAEAAKNKLEQIKFEAQQTIETAKATAEAQRISSQALAAQGGEDYVNLKAIEKWNGVLPTQFIPGQSLPFINLNK